MLYKTFRTKEFRDWLSKETLRSQVQIEARIAQIEIDGHFGTTKSVDDDLFELKWRNGRRVYYAFLREQNILLLLGGNKNDQSYDISQAKKILSRYTEDAYKS